jgi:hypothetical protein
MEGGERFKACGSCASEQDQSHPVRRKWLGRKTIAMTVVGEAGRKGLLSDGAARYGARQGARSFRVGETGFMRQS